MFATTGSRGLYKVPLSKGLLLVFTGLTVMLTLLPQYHGLFMYNLQAITTQRQVWRWACGRLVCLDLKDTVCSSLLLYNFRILERRFGTRKFASFLWGTWFLSALTDLLLAQAVYFLFDHEVEELPTGLVSVTQVLGRIPITNKTLVYLVGLQLLTSSPFMWLIALSGLISGLLYYSDVLWLQRVLFVPVWLSKIGRYVLEPLLSGPEPTGEAPLGMGATLDIQRQQRMDLLDQQLLMAEYNQARRNARPQPRAGLLNWSRLLPSLLVEMGFSRTDALEALGASNNDIVMATNFLLQH
ncbi:hypothetical protein NHX12_022027 [Muraenolepis orangiensis]|uniref:UBA domain-containing protein n=1 Tax=Muraenolepis orangiensis TaxID=630683 RepID=A0A9Q0EQT8_9TELE|nr:hypothetical protein NHX12_022027 [Muraenolepis orangiensis]